ncbi:MAG: hypothetical protein JO323_23665 [Acidobacteriia bacterium]|nr:hypothetical protein [Terriglobia bacterium]
MCSTRNPCAALGIIVKTPTLRINPVRIAPVTLRCSIPYSWQVSRISKLAALIIKNQKEIRYE